MLRAILALTAALGCFALAALAQPAGQPPDKKGEVAKGKDSPKEKNDKVKLPKDGVVVVDTLLEGIAGKSSMVLLTPETYQGLIDQIEAL